MLFEIEVEVRDSAVTLSKALAKYMVKSNQGDKKELRVMPFGEMVTDCRYCQTCVSDVPCPMYKIYGWDINPNPEETGLSQEYLDGLEVIQWNEDEKCVGFLLNNPNVTGLMITYGMRDKLLECMDTEKPIKLYVRPRMWHGRMQYMIQRIAEEELTLTERLEIWWTKWRVRLMRK